MKRILYILFLLVSFAGIRMQATAQVISVTNPQLKTRPVYDNVYFFNPANYEFLHSLGTTLTDSATAGAQIIYYIPNNPDVNGTLFNPSTLTYIYTAFTGLTDATTSTPIASGAEVTYNMVIATAPTTPGTTGTINVKETSKPKLGWGGSVDMNGGSTASITILDKPGFSIPTAIYGGCGTSASYAIAVTLTGVPPFSIDYTITGTDLNGVAIGSVIGETYTAMVGIGDNLNIDLTQLAHLCGASSSSGTINGKYTITINNLWDALSVKAVNANSLAENTPSSGISSTDIFVYPLPQTKDIQQLKVLP
jgi:hypothetical protein